MDEDLYINTDITIPAGELATRASRSGGPGGQHANKTSSRVTLEWNVEESSVLSNIQRLRILRNLAHRITDAGILAVSVDESRSQHQNKDIARERLTKLILDALKVQKVRVGTKPSKSAKRRRVDAKKQVGEKKKMRVKPHHDD
jgi:ribosome-associated protein